MLYGSGWAVFTLNGCIKLIQIEALGHLVKNVLELNQLCLQVDIRGHRFER